MFTEKEKENLHFNKLHEELEQCGKRLMEYKECFEIMGKDRNSYYQNRSGSDFYAYERRLHAERTVKASI